MICLKLIDISVRISTSKSDWMICTNQNTFFLLDLGNCYYYGNYGFYEHWSIVTVKNWDEFIINMTDRWKIVKKVNTMQKVDIVGIEIFSRLHSQFWTQSSRKYTTLFWTVYFMINTHNAINLNSSTKSEVIHVNVYSKTKKKKTIYLLPFSVRFEVNDPVPRTRL